MELESLPGARYITERELALGRLSKPTYRGDFSVQRYLNTGDVVEFGVYNEKSDFNWEFFVNHNRSIRLWYSQFNRYYLDATATKVQGGTLTLKGKKRVFLADLSPEQFWEKVRGRKFRVELDTDVYAIDPWHPNCQGQTLGNVVSFITRALDERRFDDMKGMTKYEPLFMFFEI